MYFKSLFTAAASAALLMSCAKDTQIESALEPNNTIGFRSNMTRGTETLNGNLNEFFVTAYFNGGQQPYFKDVRFHKTGATAVFNSDTPYPWPSNNSQLDFYAYSPAKAMLNNATIEWTPTSRKIKDFVVSPHISDHVDLIVATAKGAKNTHQESGVPLTFQHTLSQIQVKAKSTNPLLNYKVAGVRIRRAWGKGTWDFTTNSWTLGTGNTNKSDYDVIFPDGSNVPVGPSPTSLMQTGGNAMVFPQRLESPWNGKPRNAPDFVDGPRLEVKIQIISTSTGFQIFPKTNGDYEWVAVPLEGEWVKGKRHIYTLDFSQGAGTISPDPVKPDENIPGTPVLGGPIKFTVTVSPWTDETEKTIPLN